MRILARTRGLFVTCSLLVLVSCIAEQHPIPAGIYKNPAGDETISAWDSQLHFHIRIAPDHPERFVDRTYDYGVYKGGRLVPMTLTSAEAGLGVGRYNWTWDGEAIVRYDRRTGETVKFTPRPAQ